MHGLDFFLQLGYLFVSVFFFCSGLGLYKSFRTKPDYLKGFFRRRVLPIVIAFYLSEWIYLAIRLLAGERMKAVTILWYAAGLHMSNPNAWYIIVIPFFYLAFWAAFRFCKHEGTAIFWVFFFVIAYTVGCTFIDHQSDWWMCGEWWYNSVILFPLGLLFAKFEKPLVRFFRKGYWIWLALSFAATVFVFLRSDYLVNNVWGYYGEWGDRLKVQHRLMCVGVQWLSCILFTLFCWLLLMKLKLGNGVLAWLGKRSLEFYLMHGAFVELFGYNFLDVGKSIVYIKDVPLYTAAVLASSAAAAVLFFLLRTFVTDLLTGGRKRRRLQAAAGAADGEAPAGPRRKKRKLKDSRAAEIIRKIGRWFWPAVLVLVAAGYFLLFRQAPDKTIGGLKVVPPAGYTVTFSDARYIKWEYSGEDGKPGVLILDREIKGHRGQQFPTAESVLEESDWLADAELYVNPHGIRMVRGFSTEYSGYPERRYYVECDETVFLLSMIEDSRYYDAGDCEKAMQETADHIVRK